MSVPVARPVASSAVRPIPPAALAIRGKVPLTTTAKVSAK